MNYTENYQLNQWEKTDRVLMEDFNEDNRKIEEAILNAKPRLAVGSYTGTGEYGADHPNHLSFDFTPQVVIVFSEIGNSCGVLAIIPNGAQYTQVIRYADNAYSMFEKWMLQWKGTSLYWYANWTVNDATATRIQANALNARYFYIAFG